MKLEQRILVFASIRNYIECNLGTIIDASKKVWDILINPLTDSTFDVAHLSAKL
jgi:hypothetical protein